MKPTILTNNTNFEETRIENPELLTYQNEPLTIHILGGIRITGLDRLRVTLKLTGKEKHLFPLRYNVDLYNTDQTEKLIRKTADHFDLEVRDTRDKIMGLIETLENYRLYRIEQDNKPKREPKELTKDEEELAIHYLKSKDLMKRTGSDIGKSGVIGEEINRLLMYLVFTSRKLNNPLHLISMGESGTGKTHLQETVSKLIPEEDRIEITSLTPNSLYYFEQDELHHKLILIEDFDGTDEHSMYAIRELQSKKRLSKTLAQKDSKGNIKTETKIVEGIVSIAGTTTKERIYEDNANRSLLIHIDGSTDQDQRIMDYQRRTASNTSDLDTEQQVQELLKNCQRVLKPIKVVNPFAEYLKLPDSVKKPRRTMSLYLAFIEVITYYHQYQRKAKGKGADKYIETTKEDIYHANHLLKDVLLRKSDDLSTQVRTCLEQIETYVKRHNKELFTAREIKFTYRINSSNLKRYLHELRENGYIKITSGNRYTGLEYKLTGDNDFDTIKQEVDQAFNKLMKELGGPVVHK